MSKMIQVRNVPGRLHRELVTITRYGEDILEREVARPPSGDVFDMINESPPVRLGRPAADLIREERLKRADD